jgi:hypothetical protein
MSESNGLIQIGIEIVKIVGSFFFGLLMRKRVGRFFIKAQKWLMNSPVKIDLVSVRKYTLVETGAFTMEMFHNIQMRIPNVKLDQFSDNLMRIVVPQFGTIKIILTMEPELSQEETAEEIKISLNLENPIRLGIRETDLVHEYYHNTEIIFQILEGVLHQPRLLQDYTIAEISRVGGLLEEKIFDIDDKELSARINATQSKITISANPSRYIAKAVKKYILA